MSDTIVALATPAGRSGIGVIRLSGPDAVSIVRRLIRQDAFDPEPRVAHLRKIYDLDSGDLLDEAIFLYFRAPNSFTGEDIVEISCHGSPVVLRRVLDFCLKLDARMADPGEFSLRALENGRINLAQAEAIRDLIDSQTLAAVKQSVRQLEGEVSKRLEPIKNDLLETIVFLESALEFVEDDLPDYQIDSIAGKLFSVSEMIGSFSDTYNAGKFLRDGISVAIVGRPNVGKSSVFNALLGQDRAIVTDIAGTTRDQINENISINGVPVSLIDTAGLRETSDIVESIGVERARRTMADADLVVVLLDGSRSLTAEDHQIISQVEEINHLLAINKSDLPRAVLELNGSRTVRISAKTRAGFGEFQNAITESFYNRSDADGFLISDARHYDLLVRAKNEIDLSRSLFAQGKSEEIVLVGLHNALNLLGQITGETTTEDMLTQIFSTFCIGK